MINYIIKAIKNPQKVWRILTFRLYYFLRKKKGVLVFIGMESCGTFRLMHRGFNKCYCFEANPERFKYIKNKYKHYSNVKLYNFAVATYDGEITFNISSNNGASSSIGNFENSWKRTNGSKNIEMINSITIPCINLYNFCKKNNINFIDEYVSDIQGMDLAVLKTLKPMIDTKMISTITCEVTKDEKRNIYFDLPDNSESSFMELLGENYKLIAKGSGLLKDYKIENTPTDVWEMDCKWCLLNSKK